MAKGVEDCSFYRWSRLTSLNEVGGDPSVFAIDRRRVPRRDGRAPARLAARDDHPLDPRHQARRGRPRPDHRAGRGARPLGAGARRLLAPGARARPRLRQPAVAGGRSAPGRPTTCPTSASGCTATPRRRCARPATGRTWTEPDEAYEAPVHAAVDAVFDQTEVRAVLVDLAAASTSPAGPTRSPPSCSRSRCRACPTSTRAASSGRPRSSTPTTGAPSTSTTGPRVLAGTAEDDAADQAARHLHRPDPAARAARAVHRLRAGRRLRVRRRPRARLRPRWRDHRRHPPPRRARRGRRLGRHHPRPARGSVARRAHRRSTPTAGSPTCSRSTPWPCW